MKYNVNTEQNRTEQNRTEGLCPYTDMCTRFQTYSYALYNDSCCLKDKRVIELL